MIKVTNPATGSVWRLGCYYEIRWETTTPITDVAIYLYNSLPVLQETITVSTPNDGSYFWKVPKDISPTMFFIRIEDVSNPSDYDDSDLFRITYKKNILDKKPAGTTISPQADDTLYFIDTVDLEKVVLVEIKPGINIDGIWVQDGTYTNTWGTDFTEEVEVVDVTNNDDLLDRTFSLAECNDVDDSFFYDCENETIYVNTSGSVHTDTPHTDVAHGDTAHDDAIHEDHTDNSHDDVAYTDTHTDVAHGDHDDTYYWDTPHTDTPYGDVTHGDAHTDAYGDYDHDDGGYWDYSDYTDVPHTDTPHTDTPHGDVTHEDTYWDQPHQDSPHSDVPHSDVPHEDHTDNVHEDVAHGDVEHSDAEHEDVAHGDQSTGTPNDSGNFFMAYTWFGFINTQQPDYVVGFIPENATKSIYYLPLLDQSLPTLSQRLADYYTGALSQSFGGVNFLQNGWWWNHRHWDWHNKEVLVKLGEKYADYDEYMQIYRGLTQSPKFKDDGVSIDITDKQKSELKDIPLLYYTATDATAEGYYANLKPDLEGKKIPILFGQKTRYVSAGDETNGAIEPNLVDTVNFTYKISQTVFDGTTFALESIDDVYKGGVVLTTAVDYTEDLNNGEFTLLADPGSSKISCNAKGIKCNFDWSPVWNFDYTYSENVADILLFVLSILNGISLDDMNLSNFYILSTGRTQRLGYYLDSNMKTTDFIRLLQQTSVFHLVCDADGIYTPIYFDSYYGSIEAELQNVEYKNFELEEETNGCFRNVILEYDYCPFPDVTKTINIETPNIEYEHGSKTTLTIETCLVNDNEAQLLAEFYSRLVTDPTNKVRTELPEAAWLGLMPSARVKLTKSSITDDGSEISILNEVIYVILETNKNLSTCSTRIVAVEESQAAGVIGHVDDPYVDHTDSHTDTLHTDTLHEDIAHGDYYGDTTHTDVPHVDYYTDLYMDDVHKDYLDEYHDTAYQDIPHWNDPYQDWPHSDGHGDHSDTVHVNISHEDIPHADS